MRDLDELALELPETTKELSDDGRPAYLVHGKAFCLQRGRRPDAVDAATGERLDDVLMFRVDGPEAKELVLADPRGVFFTTPHFDNYPAVLIRIPDLARLEAGGAAGDGDRRLADSRAETRGEGMARRARRELTDGP